jgi:GGDEF domain-containing protein
LKTGSVLIISNDIKIGNQIQGKIKLLRECDIIRTVSYIESISVLNSTQPSLILVYCSNLDSANIIKEIRSIKALDKVPIIFVMDTFIEDILMHAFDCGIDDFFFLNDTDSIVLTRIFLTLQKSILYKQIDLQNEILISANIIDKQTGIYTRENAPLALKNFFSQSIEQNLENTTFMYVKPVPLPNKKFNMIKIAQVVKSVPRANDVVAFGRGMGFYLVMYNSGVSGAKSVASRIRNKLAGECKIFATAAEITSSFDEMEPVLYQSLKDQIPANIEFNYLYDMSFNEAAEVIDIRDENGKSYQVFKKEFFQNIETIIAPVFYQAQTLNKEKFPHANIEYNINETESKFRIGQEDVESELLITYPAYTKLLMDIKHSEGDAQPVIRRLSFDFEDFTSDKLTSILKDVIQEFADKINLKIINNITE